MHEEEDGNDEGLSRIENHPSFAANVDPEYTEERLPIPDNFRQREFAALTAKFPFFSQAQILNVYIQSGCNQKDTTKALKELSSYALNPEKYNRFFALSIISLCEYIISSILESSIDIAVGCITSTTSLCGVTLLMW